MTSREPELGAADQGDLDDAWLELGRRGSRAALQLALRSAVLRAVTFLGTIGLARLLSPSDFGIYGIIFFVVSVFSAVGDFGLGAALVQQAEEPTPTQLQTVWTVQQCISMTAVALVWLLAPVAATAIPGLPPEAPWMVRVLSIGLLMSSLRTLPSVMMERRLQFGPLAAAEVLQMVTFYVVAMALAFAGAGTWAFIAAGVAQLGVGALVVNLAWRRRPSIGVDGDCLRRLLGFGFHYQASVIMVTLRDTPLPAIAGLILGTVGAGMTQFAIRIALTIASIDEVVARIAFPAMARLQGKPVQQARALDGAILMTGLIVVPVQCWMAAVAPLLVPLVFGAKWDGAILPLQIICLGTLLRFPARYVRQAEFAAGKSRLGLTMTAVTTFIAVVAFALGLAVDGLPGGAVGFLIGAAVGLAATARLGRDAVPVQWRPFLMLLVSGVSACGAAVISVALIGGLVAPYMEAGVSAAAQVETAAAASVVFGAACLGMLLVTSREPLGMAQRLAGRALQAHPGSVQRG
jgi:teichuronic acid exporter